MIVLSFRLKGDADEERVREELYLLVRRASINTLHWHEGVDLYLFDSNLGPDELKRDVESDALLNEALEACVVFDVRSFKSVAALGIKSEKILRAFTET